ETCANPAVPIRGFADLTVFVNPAFEAAELRSLLETARGYGGYCPSQTPLALIAMSESDRATGVAFPLGRKLATLAQGFRGEERAQAVTAIGHYPPFDTHRLTRVGDPPAQLDPARRAADCGCATALGHFDPARHLANLRRNGESRDFKNLHFALSRSYGGSRLSQLPGLALPADLPFLVARVEPAIIDGHGDFFNPSFIDFLVNFVAAIDYKRAAWEEAD
ncbi:MAG TPA: hypothetical protein VN851_23810, partial [Thermoanaerobaculia bacterium]|nr:hypothetical protein [Thermoanaerobaculia bacterium]